VKSAPQDPGTAGRIELVSLNAAKGGHVLIGKINDKSRQKILVTIRQTKGARLVDLRVHQTNDDGELIATPSGVSLTIDQVDQAIELLREARKRTSQE
jgi:hypothetical protein